MASAETQFKLMLNQIGDSYDTFVKRLHNELQARVSAGETFEQAMTELDNDWKNGTGVFKSLAGDLGSSLDFGMNTIYQVESNNYPQNALVVRQLDPPAEHCDSCPYEASLPPRPRYQVPTPGFQPTHGETNCHRHCMCTLVEVKNAA